MSKFVDVPGHGQVEFPDDMSDEQIVAAIKSNPPKETTSKENSFGGVVSRSLEQVSSPKRIAETLFGGEMYKGVPVARHYVPTAPETANFEKQHPKMATGARALGAVASYVPIAAATAELTGPGLLANMFTQGLASGTTQVADRVNDPTFKSTGPFDVAANKDVAKEFGKGFGWGTTGPLIGKVLSPGTLPSHTPEDITKAMSKTLGNWRGITNKPNLEKQVLETVNRIPKGPGSSPSALESGLDKLMSNPRVTTPLGAIAEFGFGVPHATEVGLGIGLGQKFLAKDLLNLLPHKNTVFQQPDTQAILNAIMSATPTTAIKSKPSE